MLLAHDNLCIRHATTDDATLLAIWWNDGRIMAHVGFPNGLNTSASEIATSLNTDNDSMRRQLIIMLANIAIGEMGYRFVKHHTVDIGIKICNFSKQNSGVGTKALTLLITYLFEGLHVKKIILNTNLENKRAQHVYEKLGFQKIRIAHNNWQDQLGNYQSPFFTNF